MGTTDQVEWLFGLYYFNEDVDQALIDLHTLDSWGCITGVPNTPIEPQDSICVPDGAGGSFTIPAIPRFVEMDSRSMAAYTQATWTPSILNDRLHLTAGVRYTEDKKEGVRLFGADVTPFDLETDNTDPVLTAHFDWTEDVSTYIKWSSAYKAGGVNARSSTATFKPYDPEEVSTVEFGLKAEAFDHRLRLNTTIFRTTYDDMQFDFPDPNLIGNSLTVNAEKTVEIEGVEVDLALVPVAGLVLGLNYTYLDGDIPLQPNPVDPTQLDKFLLSHTPKHSGALTIDYTQPVGWGTLVAHLDVYSTGQFNYTSVGQRQDSYTLVNARLTLADLNLSETWAMRISAWGKNLTDEEYVVNGFPVGGAAITQAFGDPRMSGNRRNV